MRQGHAGSNPLDAFALSGCTYPADILRALHGEKGAARRLLAAIFDPRHNPVGRAGNAHMAAHRTLPPAPRRVAAWQRQLVPLMHKMLGE